MMPPYKGITAPRANLRKRSGDDPCVIPDGCPRPLMVLMRQCIAPEPQQRPTMEEIGKELDDILKEEGNSVSICLVCW